MAMRRALQDQSVLATALALLTLPSCGEKSAEADRPQAQASASPTPVDQAEPAPNSEGREVTLTSESVILVNAFEGRGTATSLDFGTAQDRVLAALEPEFGKLAVTGNAECGAGPMEFASVGGLQLNFLGSKLAGWSAEPDTNLVTSDGIRAGIALADLKSERPVEMADSTLDGEFSYQSPDGGIIGGFVGGDGKITSLHAGVNCFFR